MKKRITVKHKEVGNIEKNGICSFGIFLKQVKEKENSWLLTTNPLISNNLIDN